MNRKVFVVLETILLVIFITATIILAQRWKFDPDKGFVPTAGIKVDGVKKAQVEIGTTKRDSTPATIDYLTDTSYQVKVTKDGRQDWVDTVRVLPQYITTVFPVLFPKNIDKELKLTDLVKVYPLQSNDGFFYTKYNSSKVLELRKFVINQSIFGESTEDKKITDLSADAAAALTILPSPTGAKVLVILNGTKYILDGDIAGTLQKPVTLEGTVDQISWSESERFLIISIPGQNIFSYDIAGLQKYTISTDDANNIYTFLDTDPSKLLLLKSEKGIKPTVNSLAPVTAIPAATDSTVLSLYQSNLDGKNMDKIGLSNDQLKGLKRGFIFPNAQSLVLEYDNQVKIVNAQNQDPKTIDGQKVVSMYAEDQVLVTSSTDKIFVTDYKNDKSFIMDSDTSKLSGLMPYFKYYNLLYAQSTAVVNDKKLISNYSTGGEEVTLDEGNIQPLIAWKKSDFVRIFYTKFNTTTNTTDVLGIEFEN